MTGTKASKLSEIDHWLQEAVKYQRAGDLKSAEGLYEKVLGCEPENADALHLQGMIDFDKGDSENAIIKIKRAIVSDPDFFEFHRSLGNVNKNSGQIEEALCAYNRAISTNPMDIESLYEAGALNYSLGRLGAAESCFKMCIKLKSDHVRAYNDLGLVYRAKKRYRIATNCFTRALAINSHLSYARCNLAITLKDQGQLVTALDELQKASESDPGCPEVYYNMGLVLTEMGNSTEAIFNYKKAIALKNDFAPPHNNMGILLQEVGRTREAISCFQKAIKLDPKNAMAHYNLGVLFKYHERYSDAVFCMNKALEIDPRFTLAKKAKVNYLRDICKWTIENATMEKPGPGCEGNQREAMPESTEYMFEELSENYLEKVLVSATKRSQQIEKRSNTWSVTLSHDPKCFKKEKIIVGYISNNFRDHPTAHLVCDMFACHDRTRFEIICYSYGENDNSAYRKKIESGCDRFVDIFNISSLEAASKINNDKVQILVDLNGYTACSRTDICSFRPAPVQVRYLGEARTSGASFFDYLIGDNIVTPLVQAAYFTEKLVLMPHSYQVNSRLPIEARLAKTERILFQLPDDGFVFCSFSTSYKIDPDLFRSWMRILDRTPNSVLWLLKRDSATELNLKSAAKKLGIDPDRLVFTQPIAKNQHLSRLSSADLCLDTRVVNGAATTSDALWAGVPVVTIEGHHFASKMSASILMAVGLPELITHDLKQYEDLAVALATYPEQMGAVRDKLENNKPTCPLFDTREFVHNLESTFEQMWAIYLAGEKPQHIYSKFRIGPVDENSINRASLEERMNDDDSV